MKNIFYYLFLFLILGISSCKQQQKNPDVTPEEKQENTPVSAIPKLISLNNNVEKNVSSWVALKDFDLEMRKFYTSNSSNIFFQIDELIKKEKELSESEFPEKLNVPSVKSRIIVIKTYLLEAKDMQLQADPIAIEKQKTKIINAYNALNSQFMELYEENIAEKLLNEN
ncbi:hypothetical protein [Leptobacterium sp. I13]|uniref:hypothetical protein n=1 Tax=Leptobacterium meishanense TaxID=3128904 RepID=UPI0030ED1E9E